MILKEWRGMSEVNIDKDRNDVDEHGQTFSDIDELCWKHLLLERNER